MSSEVYYRPDTPKIIHETIDGEVVMIHMGKGYYYSLDRTGSDIWNMLTGGMALRQITGLIQEKYRGDPLEIEQSIAHLLSELKSEELIVDGRAEPNEQAAFAQPLPKEENTLGAGQKPPFIPPELHKYTDMEDLLLLDPIHEVDETGWPAVPDNT